jgi:hypothetical protein
MLFFLLNLKVGNNNQLLKPFTAIPLYLQKTITWKSLLNVYQTSAREGMQL